MTIEEIRSTFLGQTIHHHDSFSGSVTKFVITEVDIDERSVTFRGAGKWDIVSISTDAIDTLIRDRKLVETGEMDHCVYTDTITILPDQDERMKSRITELEAQIKSLKAKLVDARKQYEAYLVSSVRLDALRASEKLKVKSEK